MKTIIVSNSPAYVKEIERAGIIMPDFDIVAKYISVSDVQRNIMTIRPDIIIASDALFHDSTVEGLVKLVEQSGIPCKLFFVLTGTQWVDYLRIKGIPFVFEQQTPAYSLLEGIQVGSLVGYTNSPYQTKNDAADLQSLGQTLSVNQNNMDYVKNIEGSSTVQTNNFTGIQDIHSSPTAGTGAGVNGMNSSSNNFAGESNFARYNSAAIKNIMVAVHSPKGGVGKTCVAIELAHLLANKAKEVNLNPHSAFTTSQQVTVCLIDMNMSLDTISSTLESVRSMKDFPTLTDWASKIEYKIYAQLTQEEKNEVDKDPYHDLSRFTYSKRISFDRNEILKMLVYDEKNNLYILPTVAMPLDVTYVKPEYIQIVMNHLKALFDVVIVDTGNDVSYFTTETLRQANEVILITTPDTPAVLVCGKLVKSFERLGLDGSKFSLLINNSHGKTQLYDAATIGETLKLRVIGEIPFDEEVKKIHEKGISYACYNKKSLFSKEMTKVAHQIAPLWNTKAVTKGIKKQPKEKKSGIGFLKKK